MNRLEVIQKIIDKKRAKTYLEIGVFDGRLFLKVRANRKVAVDPKFKIRRKTKLWFLLKNYSNVFSKYYQMTSDQFFEENSSTLGESGIDVAFVDGLHTYAQSLKDVKNCLKYLNKDGVIIMHDCNPPHAAAAYLANSITHAESLNLPGWTGEWCGDVWKTIAHLRSTRTDLNIFVFDADYGLGIITKGDPEDVLAYTKREINSLSYEDFQKNKEKILNLKNIDYFKEFIVKCESGKSNVTV